MTEIVVTAIRLSDRARWAALRCRYLEFYQTRLPPEIYEHTWQRLTAQESPIRGLGARLGGLFIMGTDPARGGRRDFSAGHVLQLH